MQLSPQFYHWFVRPNWLTKFYIGTVLTDSFDFNHKTVLDFGCGTGSICGLFSPASYLGIDPDAKRITFAKKIYPGYHFLVFNNERLPIDDHTIDYIIIISVLHHISTETIQHYLTEFKRILKPGGKIIAIEPYLTSSGLSNKFMVLFDKGKYIRQEEEYFRIFEMYDFKVNLLKRFNKLLLYNELFFFASY